MKPCSKCGKEVLHVCEKATEIVKQAPYQLDEALVLTVYGGYGMFVDYAPIDWEAQGLPDIPRIVLCYDCAVQFLKDNPWAKEVVGYETIVEAKIYWEEHYKEK